jgi:hypothetical protein
MSAEIKEASGISHEERRGSAGSAKVQLVQNVAFADATAKAKVKPWTPAMFRVSTRKS